MRTQRGVRVPPRVRAAVAGGVGAAGQPPRGGWAPHAAVAGSVGCESGHVGSGGYEEAALGGGHMQGGSARKRPDAWRQRTELNCGDELCCCLGYNLIDLTRWAVSMVFELVSSGAPTPCMDQYSRRFCRCPIHPGFSCDGRCSNHLPVKG